MILDEACAAWNLNMVDRELLQNADVLHEACRCQELAIDRSANHGPLACVDSRSDNITWKMC